MIQYRRRFIATAVIATLVVLAVLFVNKPQREPVIFHAQPSTNHDASDMVLADSSAFQVEWEDLKFATDDHSTFDVMNLAPGTRELVGKKIRIRGYMDPSVSSIESDRFVLLGETKSTPINMRRMPLRRYPIALDTLMFVEMTGDQKARFTTRPVELTGRLSIEPAYMNNKPICVFRFNADSVKITTARDGYRCMYSEGC